MISDLLTSGGYPPPRPRNHELRLKMRPGRAARGDVDGGWWPWSADPAAEFPTLVMALSSWIGPISHLSSHPGDWEPTGPTLAAEGWLVHVDMLESTEANTVVLTGTKLRQLRVLVVPPGTPSSAARGALWEASSSDTATAAGVLARNGISVTRALQR